MKKIIVLNKREGKTPLQRLERFRAKSKKYKNISMTYAGRLDPIASGLLLILVGDKIKNKDKYLALDKEYDFEILFGFATDTHDILGRITHSNILTKIRIKDVERKLKFFRGQWRQKYPLYSSKTWMRVRAGEKIKPETKWVTVFNLKLSRIKKISASNLLANIYRRIKKVKGDFRQAEILKIWQRTLIQKHNQFYIGKFKIRCSSGTYVRALVHELGQKLGVPALAFSIKRTKIGNWSKISK